VALFAFFAWLVVPLIATIALSWALAAVGMTIAIVIAVGVVKIANYAKYRERQGQIDQEYPAE
jgi:uncharacterized membrane protein (DUF485 family)